jgi:putative redox protein
MATITTSFKGDMLFETKIGNHTLQADVPPSMGGKDRAPTPPELFIMSLGTCIAAFVANYCGKSSVNAENMTVDVNFEKADDPTRLTNIKVVIKMPNATCKDRQAAIRRVAEHCPVHETIVTIDDISFEILDKEGLAVK